MLLILALLASPAGSEAEDRLSRMTTLYQQVCLKTFPDDQAVANLMIARNARELAPAEVRVTMGDDPARGWDLNDGGATLWIEFPPFHACSVRWSTPQIGALSAYRTVANEYESAVGGFDRIEPFDNDQGDIHVHAVGEQRTLPDQSAEALFVIDQQINNPKRREAGETGFSIRFVHQFAAPAPGASR
jgi:hypothetical protein